MKQKENAELKRRSWTREVFGRLARNKVAMGALIVVVVVVLITMFSEQIAPYDYAKQDLTNLFSMPSAEHWCGTDNLGRDLFSRILVGGRISLLVACAAIAIATVVGCTLGAIAGFFGGWTETIIMKFLDIIMCVPQFLLAVTISAALGSGTFNTALAVGISSVPRFARMMRAEIVSARGKDYVEAARACGSGNRRIIMKHMIPNCLSSTIVNVSLCLGGAILAISGLSFVGLGVQPPTPEWGSILASGRAFMRDFWPIVIFPGIMIVIVMIAFNLLGDGLRDAMDPKLKY